MSLWCQGHTINAIWNLHSFTLLQSCKVGQGDTLLKAANFLSPFCRHGEGKGSKECSAAWVPLTTPYIFEVWQGCKLSCPAKWCSAVLLPYSHLTAARWEEWINMHLCPASELWGGEEEQQTQPNYVWQLTLPWPRSQMTDKVRGYMVNSQCMANGGTRPNSARLVALVKPSCVSIQNTYYISDIKRCQVWKH